MATVERLAELYDCYQIPVGDVLLGDSPESGPAGIAVGKVARGRDRTVRTWHAPMAMADLRRRCCAGSPLLSAPAGSSRPTAAPEVLQIRDGDYAALALTLGTTVAGLRHRARGCETGAAAWWLSVK